jgi:hypothetical protein
VADSCCAYGFAAMEQPLIRYVTVGETHETAGASVALGPRGITGRHRGVI